MAFKSSVESKSQVERQINIEIPRATYNQEFDKLLQRTATQARIKGFRPGRAPRAVVAKFYGEQIHSDVIQRLVSDAYQEVVREHDLKIVGIPSINIEDKDKEQDVKVTADVAVYPEPELNNVDGLDFEVEVLTASEEEYERRIKGLAEQFSKREPITDREVAETGDVVEIDYEATIDGEPFRGSTGSEVFVELGAGNSLEGVEEALTGAKVGQTVEATLTMPEQADKEIAGKEALYKLSLKGLFRKEVPELTDELAKETGLAEDLEGLKAFVRNELEREVRQKNRSSKEEKLFETIIERNPFEVPQAMIDEGIRDILFEMGFLDPREDRSYQIDVSQFRQGLGESSEKRIRRDIIVGTLRDRDGTEYSDEDVDSWLNELAERERLERDAVNSRYGYPENMSRLKIMLAHDKIVDKLLESANITEKEAAEKEEA